MTAVPTPRPTTEHICRCPDCRAAELATRGRR